MSTSLTNQTIDSDIIATSAANTTSKINSDHDDLKATNTNTTQNIPQTTDITGTDNNNNKDSNNDNNDNNINAIGPKSNLITSRRDGNSRGKKNENIYKHIIIIAGNHETSLDENNPSFYVNWFFTNVGQHCYYLQDTCVELYGLKFWGTPWHPKRGCCYKAEAFGTGLKRIKKLFNNIDIDTDILITHVPPYGIRDTETAGHIGSDTLLKNIRDRIHPYIHVFGHSHHNTGLSYIENCDTLFVNTATRPRVFDITFQGLVKEEKEKENGDQEEDDDEKQRGIEQERKREKETELKVNGNQNLDVDTNVDRELTPSEGSDNDKQDIEYD